MRIPIIVLMSILPVLLFAYDLAKANDSTKTDDVVIVLKVQVKIENERLKPDVPKALMELCKGRTCYYDADEKNDITQCIVVLTLPKENVAEFMARNLTYPTKITQLLSDIKGYKATFKDLEAGKLRTEGSITNAKD